MSTEQLFYTSLERPGIAARITEDNRRLTLHLDWKKEKRPDDRTQSLPLPRFFESFDQIGERDLQVSWHEGATAKEVYSSLLEGFDTYVTLKYPGFWILTPIKAYAQRVHGVEQHFRYTLAPVVGQLDEIRQEARHNQNKNDELWTGGYSDLLLVSPEPGYRFGDNEVPRYPFDFPLRTIIPMLDLDVDVSNNPARDLRQVSDNLAKAGFSGWLIRSGDSREGSYHYLADFLMPYSPFFWQIKGQLMKLLTPTHNSLDSLHEFADRLIAANSLPEAQEVAKDILQRISSGVKTGSNIDFRWIAHRIKAGITILRSLPAKGYIKPPLIVAEIK